MNELPRLPPVHAPTGGTRTRRTTRRPLADLAAGHEGRIAGLRLGDGARAREGSPLRVGAHVYVVESTGHGWQHVRIGFREYSVPLRVAERVEVDALPPNSVASPPSQAAPSPAAWDARDRLRDRDLPRDRTQPDEEALARADEHYQVLLTRRRRTIWRVLVIHRRGTVVRSLLFDDRQDARALWDRLRAEAESTTAAEFRARHGLP